jgi:uroporphyrinogen-III synthase
VRFFLQAAGDGGALSPQARVVSIGPVTSEALADHGVHPHVEATTHDLDGLVAALLADAAARR